MVELGSTLRPRKSPTKKVPSAGGDAGTFTPGGSFTGSPSEAVSRGGGGTSPALGSTLTRRRSGGSRGKSNAQIALESRQAQASAQAAAVAKAKVETERKRISQEREVTRQSRIQAGTVAG